MGKTLGEINEITRDIVSFDMRDEDTIVYLKYIMPLPAGSRVVDIGTGQAKNAIRMALCNPKAEIWTWDWGHGNPETVPHEYFKMITDRLRDKKINNVYFSIADSDKAWPTWDWPIDVLNIDASHEYSQTLKDLDRWLPFVKPKGLVMIHDYAYMGPDGYKFEGLRQAIAEKLSHAKLIEYVGGTQVVRL